ncbi:MAG: hypothetical protein HFG20_06575 [Anaerotruncus sp.]|nr:hypothetical protein [Anaerotruncus sp.]
MIWTDVALYAALGLLAVVLLCWGGNLFLVSRKGSPSMLLSRIMYLAAIAAVLFNTARSAVAYNEKSMLVANLIVLVCIIISFRRMERFHKYGEPQDPEE